jgi:hypothetical protein
MTRVLAAALVLVAPLAGQSPQVPGAAAEGTRQACGGVKVRARTDLPRAQGSR